jgi:hypothetical protein
MAAHAHPVDAEHGVAGAEAGHGLADGLDDAGELDAEHGLPKFADAEHQPRQRSAACRQRQAADPPVAGSHRGRADADEDLVVLGRGLGDVPQLQHVGRSLAFIDHGFHWDILPAALPPRHGKM